MKLQNSNPQVQLVDTTGRCIGVEDKMTVHQTGQLHLAFSVFICRERYGKYEFLLQQRAKHKYHSGGLWTNTCCSHPMPNESIIDAAKRRVVEEIGLKQDLAYIPLSPFIYFSALDNGLYEHEFDYPLIAFADDVDVELNPDEVAAIDWWGEDKIIQALDTTPHIFTAWFRQVFQITMKELDENIQDILNDKTNFKVAPACSFETD